ncbi:cytochrome c oxidase subunit I [Microbulbifer elongatus]|uniref:cytochrome-c oxidase n=1 Tax=Microbulbifer elongatus TaxID=86173 RepID=A0ABT1P0U8_9GAMM|nr:cytochrome c oxidase subunit I [Microbulbifer elongatus]
MNALKRHRLLTRIWASDPGWKRCFTTVSHTDLGRMFLAAAFFFFAVGGVLAMLIRAQLASPHAAFMGPDIYNQVFTMHGTMMMFLFAIPAFEGLAVYLLPKMLGARDLAFPRLTAYGFWCYAFGGSMMLISMLVGLAPDGGWFMYPPLTGAAASPGINTDVWLLGVTFVEISAICAAVELCVSILKFRAPGMSLDKMPIFAWYALVTALMILTGFPPLILGSILLELERAFGLPFFDTALGGDSLLWQHLFWLFGHPEVYIIFLPAAGLISTIIPVMSRTPLLAYGWVVASIVALAFLSFGLWVHHMFATGIPHMGVAFFSAASTLVAVPTAVQVFAWIGTMWQGRPQLHMPMLYILGFFATFVIGGLTGVMLAIVPFDWQAHDTAFVTAHLHYVLFGGFVFPVLAGLYYYAPLVTGRRRFFRIGEYAFALVFIGFHGTFLAMHWVGLLGQRRRIYTYDTDMGWGVINLISSVGSFVLAIGLAMVLLDLALNAYVAIRGKRNPWRAGTLEWSMMLPPSTYNFPSLPRVTSREPLIETPDLPTRLARGEGYLAVPRDNRREMLTVSTTRAEPESLVIYPGNTALPMCMAAVTGSFFLSLLFKVYWFTPFAVIGVIALAWRWVWGLGSRTDEADQNIGFGETVPHATQTNRSQGWWGSAFLMIADATLFGSLIFGYAFLWTIAPNWPPPQWLAFTLWEPLTGVAAAGLAFFAARQIPGCIRQEKCKTEGTTRRWFPWRLSPQLALVGLTTLAVIFVNLLWRAPSPTEHAYGAVLCVISAYGLFHVLLAILMLVFFIFRIGHGFISTRRRAEVEIVRLWIDYAVLIGLVSLMLILSPVLFT